MLDVSKMLENIDIHPKPGLELTTQEMRRYVKLKILEQQLQQIKSEILEEAQQLFDNFSIEEIQAIENVLKETLPSFNVPKYFTVREVAMLTKLPPKVIRQNCINGNYKSYQSSGENGTWFIESEQFLSHPSWMEFLQERDERFSRSKKVAELALELWDNEEELF